MANKLLKVAEECLELMQKPIETTKSELDITEKDMEDKEKKTNSKIMTENDVRNLEELNKLAKWNVEATANLKSSMMKKTVKNVEDRESCVATKEKILQTVEDKRIEKNFEVLKKPQIPEKAGETLKVLQSYEKPICAVPEMKEKTLEVKKNSKVNEKTAEKEKIFSKDVKAKNSFNDSWNNLIGREMEIGDKNLGGCEKNEVIQEKSEFEDKSVRPKETRRINYKENKSAEKKPTRTKETPSTLEPEFVKVKSVKPTRTEETPSTLEPEFVKVKSVKPTEKSKTFDEESERTKKKSVERNENPPQIEEDEELEDSNDCLPAYTTGMDNPLNAMLFSEQLIEYVLNRLGLVWPCIEGARNLPKESVQMRFSKVIGEAMVDIIGSNIEKISESYKQLVEKNIHKIDSFRREVCTTATVYFAEGYNHYNFLTYAAQLSGLSAFYFTSGNKQIAEASAQVLAYILNYCIYQLQFSPNYDWFNLHLEAQNLRRDIENRKIQFVMPA